MDGHGAVSYTHLAISDKADDSANVDYSEFEAKAVEHSVRLMAAMLEEL